MAACQALPLALRALRFGSQCSPVGVIAVINHVLIMSCIALPLISRLLLVAPEIPEIERGEQQAHC